MLGAPATFAPRFDWIGYLYVNFLLTVALASIGHLANFEFTVTNRFSHLEQLKTPHHETIKARESTITITITIRSLLFFRFLKLEFVQREKVGKIWKARGVNSSDWSTNRAETLLWLVKFQVHCHRNRIIIQRRFCETRQYRDIRLSETKTDNCNLTKAQYKSLQKRLPKQCWSVIFTYKESPPAKSCCVEICWENNLAKCPHWKFGFSVWKARARISFHPWWVLLLSLCRSKRK